MIEDLVFNLKKENPELQRHCASAIFKVNFKINLLVLEYVKLSQRF